MGINKLILQLNYIQVDEILNIAKIIIRDIMK